MGHRAMSGTALAPLYGCTYSHTVLYPRAGMTTGTVRGYSTVYCKRILTVSPYYVAVVTSRYHTVPSTVTRTVWRDCTRIHVHLSAWSFLVAPFPPGTQMSNMSTMREADEVTQPLPVLGDAH